MYIYDVHVWCMGWWWYMIWYIWNGYQNDKLMEHSGENNSILKLLNDNQSNIERLYWPSSCIHTCVAYPVCSHSIVHINMIHSDGVMWCDGIRLGSIQLETMRILQSIEWMIHLLLIISSLCIVHSTHGWMVLFGDWRIQISNELILEAFGREKRRINKQNTMNITTINNHMAPIPIISYISHTWHGTCIVSLTHISAYINNICTHI